MKASIIITQLNLPNLLSFIRLCLVPFIITFLSQGNFKLAFVLFLFCGITDYLDGLIARKFKLQTALGAFLDPLADKILMASTFITLTLKLPNQVFEIPTFITILVISRDFFIVFVAFLIYLIFDIKSFPPTILGKINTVIQVFTILLVIFSNIDTRFGFLLNYFYILLLISAILSGFHYLTRTLNWLKKNP
ncbi:MAG: CDP-alcohol phosphatidyltransferase family protein [Thermoanaerobaculia bacterium]